MSEKNKKEKPYYAHSVENQPESQWQTLSGHLSQVGEMAAGFAAYFGVQAVQRGDYPDLNALQLTTSSPVRTVQIPRQCAGYLAESRTHRSHQRTHLWQAVQQPDWFGFV